VTPRSVNCGDHGPLPKWNPLDTKDCHSPAIYRQIGGRGSPQSSSAYLSTVFHFTSTMYNHRSSDCSRLSYTSTAGSYVRPQLRYSTASSDFRPASSGGSFQFPYIENWCWLSPTENGHRGYRSQHSFITSDFWEDGRDSCCRCVTGRRGKCPGWTAIPHKVVRFIIDVTCCPCTLMGCYASRRGLEIDIP
jgi:hypothetical protein